MSRTNPSAANGCANNHPKPVSSPEPEPAGNNGRDQKGRFTRGNQESRGNPFAASIAKLRKAALEVVTPQEMQSVFRVLLLRAQTGELAAMKLLFAYTFGKPAAAVDPDEVEPEEPAKDAERAVVPDRQEVAQGLQAFIQSAASALPADSWDQLVSGFTAVAGTVLHKPSQTDIEDPEPCSPDAPPEQKPAQPCEQAETSCSPVVQQNAWTDKDGTVQPGQTSSEGEPQQMNEQPQAARKVVPGKAPGSGTSGQGQHRRLTQRQEATADDERGKHTPERDTAEANGKCGSS